MLMQYLSQVRAVKCSSAVALCKVMDLRCILFLMNMQHLSTVFGRLSHHPGRLLHQLHQNFNAIILWQLFATG